MTARSRVANRGTPSRSTGSITAALLELPRNEITISPACNPFKAPEGGAPTLASRRGSTPLPSKSPTITARESPEPRTTADPLKMLAHAWRGIAFIDRCSSHEFKNVNGTGFYYEIKTGMVCDSREGGIKSETGWSGFQTRVVMNPDQGGLESRPPWSWIYDHSEQTMLDHCGKIDLNAQKSIKCRHKVWPPLPGAGFVNYVFLEP